MTSSYNCNRCTKQFRRKDYLIKHNNRKYPCKPINSNINNTVNPAAVNPTTVNLNTTVNSTINSTVNPIVNSTTTTTVNSNVSCNRCLIQFNSEDLLIQHLEQITPCINNTIRKCIRCQEVFIDRNRLISHLQELIACKPVKKKI